MTSNRVKKNTYTYFIEKTVIVRRGKNRPVSYNNINRYIIFMLQTDDSHRSVGTYVTFLKFYYTYMYNLYIIGTYR